VDRGEREAGLRNALSLAEESGTRENRAAAPLEERAKSIRPK